MYFLIQYGAAGDMYSLNTTFSLFNLVLQQESTITGDKLIKFWSRSDSRWLSDRNMYMKPIFGHIFVLD